MTAPRLEGPARDLYFLRHPELWPVWPYLPVIRHKPNEDDDVGVLYQGELISARPIICRSLISARGQTYDFLRTRPRITEENHGPVPTRSP